MLLLWAVVGTGALDNVSSAQSPTKTKRKAESNKSSADAPKQIAWLEKQANRFEAKGRFARAAQYLETALALIEDYRGPRHVDTAAVLNNLAELYRKMGQFAKAEPLYRRSLRICEAKLGKHHPEVSIRLNNLAILCTDTGRYAEAESHLRRTVAIKEEKLGKNHPEVGLALNNLAELYRQMGQYAKAEPLCRRSLKIRETKLGRGHLAVARSLHNLALVYEGMNQFDRAEPLYRRSLDIQEAQLGKQHPDVALCLHSLANYYRRMGEFARAEPLFVRSLEIWEAKLGKDHPDVAGSLNDLAMLYGEIGQHSRAEPLFVRSLEIWEAKLGKEHFYVAQSLNNLGVLLASRGQTSDAFHRIDQARRILQKHIGNVLPLLAEQEQQHFLREKIEWNYYRALSLGVWQAKDGQANGLTASWLLNGKGLTQEVLAGATLLQCDTADRATAKLALELAKVRRELGRLTTTQPPAGQEAQRRLDLARLSAREQEWSRRMRQAGGRALAARWIELDELRQKLPPGEAFIDLARFDVFDFKAELGKKWQPAHYVAWLTPAEGAVQVVDLGPADAIEEAAAAVRAAVENGPRAIKQDGEAAAEKTLREALQKLGKLILDPLLPHLGAATTLYLSPDASLWLTPWAALPLPDGKYAVEKYTIRLVVSGRDLVTEPARPTRRVQTPLLLADPDFDLGRGEALEMARAILRGQAGEEALRSPSAGLPLGNIRRLPYTAIEAEAVASHLQEWFGARPRVFTGKRALESVFKAARNPKVLMISTHGFFLPDQETDPSQLNRLSVRPGPAHTNEVKPWENPLLRCGLLLAGCNNPPKDGEAGDDGVLTGLEIVGTDLRGTELVVLSACETGLGDVRNGEGVSGLRQAFQLAGAEAVVATLWQIPDRQSAQLMIRFFDELAAKKDKATALAEAQRATIKERRERYGAAHPFYWAAYTLTGR